MKISFAVLSLFLTAAVWAAEVPIPVPADSKAHHFLVEKSGIGAGRLLVSKRVGPEGISFTKRLFNCSNQTVKFLSSSNNLDDIDSAKPDKTMKAITPGSIEYYLGVEACK